MDSYDNSFDTAIWNDGNWKYKYCHSNLQDNNKTKRLSSEWERYFRPGPANFTKYFINLDNCNLPSFDTTISDISTHGFCL